MNKINKYNRQIEVKQTDLIRIYTYRHKQFNQKRIKH